MPEHLLLLTGTLAEQSLKRIMQEIGAREFTWEVRPLRLKVAALMTEELIRRRLSDLAGVDRVLVPGRCRGDLQALTTEFGVTFQRGPDELRDLPEYFGRGGRPPDLSRYSVSIFAEIVDAPHLDTEAIATRAARYRQDGADVIDLGCLPDVPFPHLAQAVRRLKEEGYRVSVDSLRPEDLLEGGRAGADFLLSLTEQTLWIANEVDSVPVLIPATSGDLESLVRAYTAMERGGLPCILDPVLDPIHFGFTDSLVRYHSLRRRLPEATLMMGTGNLSELTEADTTGINAVLMGIVSELGITNVLTTEVSPHCRSVVRQIDLARRIMFRAREDRALPKLIDAGLTALHERKPFPYPLEEIRAAAVRIKDPSYRIQVSEQGIHVYNRAGFHSALDPFELFPSLSVEQDGGHAFYLGVELARAQVAHQLGKRYTQDQPLGWGCTVRLPEEDLSGYGPPVPTRSRKPD
jgi:dihydropteroate synthase-like protein